MLINAIYNSTSAKKPFLGNNVITANETSPNFEAKKNKKAERLTPGQVALGVMTDEQIIQINKTKTLPKGFVFQYIGSKRGSNQDYIIAQSILGMKKKGSETLPEGFELRRTQLEGYTISLIDSKENYYNGYKVKPNIEA